MSIETDKDTNKPEPLHGERDGHSRAAEATVMRNLTGDKEPPRPIVTDSLITVRLSDPVASAPPRPLPSPTPTLKLVTESNTVYDVDGTLADVELTESPLTSSRRGSISSEHSQKDVDWEVLAKNEDEQCRVSEAQEEKTAFLIARLEKENSRLESDPKASMARDQDKIKRPPSLHSLRKLMTSPCPEKMRYSMLPSPPPLTDLEFYGALVADYKRCASKLPFLLSKKIKAGIPPPLRGVVWISMAGARDSDLEATYDHLSGEQSPYDGIIGKDVGRTGLEMFRQDGGEGQRLLGRVLRAFSLYDSEIGYCQGLGFLVGPLLMHMGEKEAFCVLVRLMEHYDLRSCFIPSLYGLRLRMFQYQNLLETAAPQLYEHFDKLGIQPTYASQWFLSFFAVTCPLPILLRIYDIIFAEGASETIMRVALVLMQKNEGKLLAMTEFDDVMQMLLSRSLWDIYGFSADELIADFDKLSGTVTRAVLNQLEAEFKGKHPDDSVKPVPDEISALENIQAAAASFLGRLWGGPPLQLSLAPNNEKLRQQLRSSESKGSFGSTNSSFETQSSNSTLPSTVSHIPSQQGTANRSSSRSTAPKKNKDEDLHGQIEDLLTAMSTLQRDNASKDEEMARLRKLHEEERLKTRRLVELLSVEDQDSVHEISVLCDALTDMFNQPAKPEAVPPPKVASNDTAKQLAEELQQTRQDLLAETAKAKELEARVAEQSADIQRLKAQVLEIKSRWETSHKEKQRLERSLFESRQRKGSYHDLDEPRTPPAFEPQPSTGLREFKLGRSASSRSHHTFNKRSSSLGMQSVLASDQNGPTSAEALLMELVNAKTAEATAKQEAEEAKAKLEALRRALKKESAGSLIPPGSPLDRATSFGSFMSSSSTPPATNAPAATAASVFSSWTGWGKRVSP